MQLLPVGRVWALVEDIRGSRLLIGPPGALLQGFSHHDYPVGVLLEAPFWYYTAVVQQF